MGGFSWATQEVSRSGLFPPSRPIPKDPRSGFRRGPGEPGAVRRPGAGGGGGHAGGDVSGGSTPPGETRAPFPALAPPASASICLRTHVIVSLVCCKRNCVTICFSQGSSPNGRLASRCRRLFCFAEGLDCGGLAPKNKSSGSTWVFGVL